MANIEEVTANEELKGQESYTPTQSKEEAERQLRITFLAVEGINALQQEVIKQANAQIDAFNSERKKYIELNAIAVKDIEFYQSKEKLNSRDTAKQGEAK